ncbi:unnamed protein product [Natator depressus]
MWSGDAAKLEHLQMSRELGLCQREREQQEFQNQHFLEFVTGLSQSLLQETSHTPGFASHAAPGVLISTIANTVLVLRATARSRTELRAGDGQTENWGDEDSQCFN